MMEANTCLVWGWRAVRRAKISGRLGLREGETLAWEAGGYGNGEMVGEKKGNEVAN
jgi:hypothetical protein